MDSVLPLRVAGLDFEAGGRRLIEDLSFTLEAGELALVLGPNGAGKSLLLRLCHGLLSPRAGTIDWGGYEPSRARVQVAMVFQRPVLLRRTALANIAYALSLRGIGGEEARRRALAALDWTGLGHLAHRQARVLSGGEQQRLAIARAWALEPQVLILDEPTSNLDPNATHSVEAAVADIHAAGTTILMTSHDLGQVRRLASQVLFIHQGRLWEQTPAAEFFHRPRTSQARAFLRGDLLL
ncbi:MAG: ATP-binding cassette domain-containing protein [Candidatus Competibacteraceae bacterium]|nr:ATP-binding cassette domain-containing protein [Candidatus Competibacteraceae bacterium]